MIGLDVLFIGADIADMRKGEGDDLAGIGRIGEDFLIAGHGGVEADFADGLANGAEAEALDHRAVGQDEQRRGDGLGPALIFLLVLILRHARSTPLPLGLPAARLRHALRIMGSKCATEMIVSQLCEFQGHAALWAPADRLSFVQTCSREKRHQGQLSLANSPNGA